MEWFPHQSTARSDPKLVALRRSQGPVGEVVWWHLLEVCTQEEGPLVVYNGDYKTARAVLSLEPEWRCDLKKILAAMATLQLVVHSGAGEKIESWEVARLKEYIGAATERREAWKERKRKERARKKGHGDVTEMSRGTERDSHGGSHDTELIQTPTETHLPIALKGEVPKLPRQTVRGVRCPNCGAEPGRKCLGVSGAYERESNHMERVYAAVEAQTKTKTQRREAIEDCATCAGRSFILDANDNAVDCPDCTPGLRVVQ